MVSENSDMDADLFIQQGVARAARTYLKKSKAVADRGGSKEDEEEHFRRALKAIKTLGVNLVSPNLTKEENDDWKYLREKGWVTDEDGRSYQSTPLDDRDRERLNFLNRKALVNWNPQISSEDGADEDL